MSTVLELKEKRAELWERMKAMVDATEAENRNMTAEEEANWTAANTDIEAMDQRIARQEQLERTPATRTQNRLETANLAAPVSLRATPEYAKAFESYVRCERQVDLDPESRSILRGGYQAFDARAMGVNVPTAGGYLVPEGFERRIEDAMLWYGGMREAATIMPTSTGNDLPMPTSDDTTNTGEILAENTAASEQDITVGARILKAFMYSSKIIRVSYQFLQDPGVDVESWLSEKLGIRIARITNTHFTVGTGANQPSGIAGDATTGVSAATGQTTSVTWDDLITLEHTIDPSYRRQGRYMFRDATLREIRKLKDGEGRYLWQPGMPGGGGGGQFPGGNTINGFPYTINSDVAAMAASAVSIFFGDLKKYIIRDVRGFALMRLEERYAEYLQVGFLGFSRHDGVLLDAGTNPVKTYVNAAS